VFTVTFVLHEKDGLERTEALRYWRETHGPLVAEVPGVQRYVQQHAVGGPDGTPPFLGVASLSFADEQAFGAAAASPAFAAAVADVANFADASRLPTAFVDEVVIVG
jgi:uncharacterized protein (TIGR02118 family)